MASLEHTSSCSSDKTRYIIISLINRSVYGKDLSCYDDGEWYKPNKGTLSAWADFTEKLSRYNSSIIMTPEFISSYNKLIDAETQQADIATNNI